MKVTKRVFGQDSNRKERDDEFLTLPWFPTLRNFHFCSLLHMHPQIRRIKSMGCLDLIHGQQGVRMEKQILVGVLKLLM
jgi:hypothetical protein